MKKILFCLMFMAGIVHAGDKTQSAVLINGNIFLGELPSEELQKEKDGAKVSPAWVRLLTSMIKETADQFSKSGVNFSIQSEASTTAPITNFMKKIEPFRIQGLKKFFDDSQKNSESKKIAFFYDILEKIPKNDSLPGNLFFLPTMNFCVAYMAGGRNQKQYLEYYVKPRRNILLHMKKLFIEKVDGQLEKLYEEIEKNIKKNLHPDNLNRDIKVLEMFFIVLVMRSTLGGDFKLTQDKDFVENSMLDKTTFPYYLCELGPIEEWVSKNLTQDAATKAITNFVTVEKNIRLQNQNKR